MNEGCKNQGKAIPLRLPANFLQTRILNDLNYWVWYL